MPTGFVYHGAGELFSDRSAALAHCTSLVRTLGLSKRHHLDSVAEGGEGEDGGGAGADKASGDGSAGKLSGELQV